MKRYRIGHDSMFVWVDRTKWSKMNSFRSLKYFTNMLYHLVYQKWPHHTIHDEIVHMLGIYSKYFRNMLYHSYRCSIIHLIKQNYIPFHTTSSYSLPNTQFVSSYLKPFHSINHFIQNRFGTTNQTLPYSPPCDTASQCNILNPCELWKPIALCGV
jgi:hypothetical protein